MLDDMLVKNKGERRSQFNGPIDNNFTMLPIKSNITFKKMSIKIKSTRGARPNNNVNSVIFLSPEEKHNARLMIDL